MSPKRDPATGEPRDRIDLTNLDQPLSPDADASKRDVVDYLDAVADRILPGVVGRPAGTAAYHCREGAARTAACFPTRSASLQGRSRDSLPATRIAYAARSGTSCSMRLRITSGSATSG
jgi:DNA primase